MLEDHLTPRVALWVHIAAGVCIGIVAATFIIWQASGVIARVALEDGLKAMRLMSERTEQRRTETEQKRVASIEAARQQAAATTLAEKQEKAKQLADAERREMTWARFYKKPSECDESRGGAWTTDCANGYIRAKAKFAELYDAGKL